VGAAAVVAVGTVVANAKVSNVAVVVLVHLFYCNKFISYKISSYLIPIENISNK
jgi:hypothetical protein